MCFNIIRFYLNVVCSTDKKSPLSITHFYRVPSNFASYIATLPSETNIICSESIYHVFDTNFQFPDVRRLSHVITES